MAKRRGKRRIKEKECPVCGSNVKKLEKHVRLEHPEVWKASKADALREALIEEPLSDEEKLDAAAEFFENEEYDMVLEMMKHVSPSFLDMASVFDYMGMALSQLGDYNEAEHYMKMAVALEPGLPETRFNLALTLLKNAKLYAAIEELEKIDISKAYPESQYMIRDAKDFMNEEMQSLSEEKGLSKELALISYRTFIEGHELMLSANYPESIVKFEEVLAIEPDSYSAFGNIGTAHLKLGDHKKARQYLDKALSINPDYIYAIHNLRTLNKLEKGEASGIGLSFELFSEDEKKMVPYTEIIGDALESALHSTAFYKVKDLKRVRTELEKYEEFEMVDWGEHFMEAVWARENPNHILKGDMPETSEVPVSVLGNLTLIWDGLKLTTMSLGRLRVLENIVLKKCGLEDVLEHDEEYFEEMGGPKMEPDKEEKE